MTNNTREKLISNDEELKQLLEVHLGKNKQVEKIFKIIKNNYKDGKVTKSFFNSWAFFGSIFYFLYKKMYIVAGFLLVAIVASEFFNIGSGAVSAAIGGACGAGAIPLYINKFFKDAEKSGYGHKEFSEVKKNMAKIGGVNHWVIPLYFIFIVFATYVLFFMDMKNL